MSDPATQLSDNLLTENFQNNPLTMSVTLTIKNRLGLHARAAGKLVHAASNFKSQLILIKDDCHADVRSIVSLISLGCPYNTEVVLAACGEDAPEALEALSGIVNNLFGEI